MSGERFRTELERLVACFGPPLGSSRANARELVEHFCQTYKGESTVRDVLDGLVKAGIDLIETNWPHSRYYADHAKSAMAAFVQHVARMSGVTVAVKAEDFNVDRSAQQFPSGGQKKKGEEKRMDYNQAYKLGEYLGRIARRPGHWDSITQDELGNGSRFANQEYKDAIQHVHSACRDVRAQKGDAGGRLVIEDMVAVGDKLATHWSANARLAGEALHKVVKPLLERKQRQADQNYNRSYFGRAQDLCPTCGKPR